MKADILWLWAHPGWLFVGMVLLIAALLWRQMTDILSYRGETRTNHMHTLLGMGVALALFVWLGVPEVDYFRQPNPTFNGGLAILSVKLAPVLQYFV